MVIEIRKLVSWVGEGSDSKGHKKSYWDNGDVDTVK